MERKPKGEQFKRKLTFMYRDENGYVWYDHEADMRRRWAGVIQRRAEPGQIYEFECEQGHEADGLVVVKNSGLFSGQCDTDDVAQWAITHKANALQRAAKADDAWKERLEPLRRAYRSAQSAQKKAAIIATAIKYITAHK